MAIVNSAPRRSKARKPTIWESLTTKLGREPTHKEACDEVRRILDEALTEQAERGKLSHQRPRRTLAAHYRAEELERGRDAT